VTLPTKCSEDSEQSIGIKEYSPAQELGHGAGDLNLRVWDKLLFK